MRASHRLWGAVANAAANPTPSTRAALPIPCLMLPSPCSKGAYWWLECPQAAHTTPPTEADPAKAVLDHAVSWHDLWHVCNTFSQRHACPASDMGLRIRPLELPEHWLNTTMAFTGALVLLFWVCCTIKGHFDVTRPPPPGISLIGRGHLLIDRASLSWFLKIPLKDFGVAYYKCSTIIKGNASRP